MPLQKHWLNRYPEITGDAYQELCQSIAKGYNPIYPIVIYEGAILDGWNRHRACIENGVKPLTIQFEGTDEEALQAVIDSNRRRDMSQSTRAAMAVECADLWRVLGERARERQGARNDLRGNIVATLPQGSTTAPHTPAAPTSAKTRNQVAAAFGVSPRYVQDAKGIMERRPDLHARIKTGEMSIPEARKAERDTIRHERNAAQAAQVQSNPDAPIVTLESYADWLPTQPDADMILTDPPYSTDVPNIEAFAADWLPTALAKLKPTGRAYIFIGAYPREVAAYCNVAMPEQILVWTYRNTLGPTPRMDYVRNLQFILYYRGPDAAPLDCPNIIDQISVQDFNHPARSAERYHSWQKPDKLAERFIQHATTPGAVVLDPFCCTGTFPLAAARLGRIGRGCDISQENLNISIERGCRYE